MYTIIVSVIVIGILIFIHELGHFLLAKFNGVKVEKFSLGFGPKLFGFIKGETEYLLSAIPLGGYVKMAGEELGDEKTGEPWEFPSKPPFARMQIVAAGPVMNIIFTYIVFVFLYFSGMQVSGTTIGSVMDKYPAKEAGLASGDKIVQINAHPVNKWSEMLEFIHGSNGQTLSIKIKRGDQMLDFAITPRVEEATNAFGEKKSIGLIGITPGSEFLVERNGVGQSLILGAEHTWMMMALTYKGLWAIVTGKISAKNLGGPIMIAQMTGEQSRAGWLQLFYFMAFISINLATLNLLPLPILDGGHIMFIGIEMVIGKPVKQVVMEWAQKISFSLLIALMLFVTFNDIKRLIPAWN